MNNSANWQQRQSDFFDNELPAPSNAGHLRVSDEKLRELRPELYGLSGLIYRLFVLVGQQFNDKQFIRECLDGGDSRAAVVVSVQPLMVAAYSDELDAVAMLRCPDHLVQKYGLKPGSRLLTVNNYGADSGALDLVAGPKNTGNWDNIIPTIAEFVSDDLAEIDRLKRQIPEQEWRRAWAMGQQYLKALPGVYRDGRPFYAGMPRAGATEYEANLKRAQKARMTMLGGAASVVLVLLMCAGAGPMLIRAQVRNQAGNLARNDPPAGGNHVVVLPGPPGMPIANPAVGNVATGEKVEAFFAGNWVAGEVVRVMPDGFADVQLISGPRIFLPPHLVRKSSASQAPTAASTVPSTPHAATYRPITPKPGADPQSAATPPATQPSAGAIAGQEPLEKSEPIDPFAKRTWVDSTGNFRIDATFVELRDGKVHLKTIDGGTMQIPLQRLSEKDREFVETHSKE